MTSGLILAGKIICLYIRDPGQRTMEAVMEAGRHLQTNLTAGGLWWAVNKNYKEKKKMQMHSLPVNRDWKMKLMLHLF